MAASPFTTGDVRNSLWAARSALRRLRAPAEVVEAGGLLHGEPSAVLQALRFVFSRYPRTLERCATAAAVGGGACCASEQDAAAAAASAVSVAAAGNGDAAPCCATSSSSCSSSVSLAGRALLSAACPPARFATAAVRALRHGLGIARVGLTPAQLLERGYAERKLILISEAATAARGLEAQGAAAARRGCGDGGGAYQEKQRGVAVGGWPVAAGARGPGAASARGGRAAAPFGAASGGPSEPVEKHFERSLRSEGRRVPAPAPAPPRRRRPLPPPSRLSSGSEEEGGEEGGGDPLPRRAPPPRPLSLPPAAFDAFRSPAEEAREEGTSSESDDDDDDGGENDGDGGGGDDDAPLSKQNRNNTSSTDRDGSSCPVRRAEAAASRAVSALGCLGERVAALEGAVLTLRSAPAPSPPPPPPPRTEPGAREQPGRGFSDDDSDELEAPRSPTRRRHGGGGVGSNSSSRLLRSSPPLEESSSGSMSRRGGGAGVPRLCLPPPPPPPPPPPALLPGNTASSCSSNGSGGRDFASGSDAFVAALEARAEAARSWLEAVSRVE